MDKETIKIARQFAKKVRKEIVVSKIILFGSRATGTNFITSDFDFIIVSSDFHGTDFIKRGLNLYDCWDNNYSVDFLCYTPEEFEKKANEICVVSEAVKTGIEI